MRKPEIFGQYLRRKRLEAGVTLRGLATALVISHVYLGDVETGRRPPLKQERWPQILEHIPGTTARELCRLARAYRPLPLDIRHAPKGYQDLALLFCERFKERSLKAADVKAITFILNQ